jgi:superfamily II DNA or RNA helicase
VLDAIARAVLGDGEDADVKLGSVTLRPHQRDALRRIRAGFAEFGGALLADKPGLGKTFVALAISREHASTIVVAPAALRDMWREASLRADAPLRFLSFEALSRRETHERADLIIVDEAHHACNPRAARYARLARLTERARVLLLSATPVRNRRSEIDTLLGLFLGHRAGHLAESARSRCVIRRSGEALALPRVDGPHWHAAPRALDIGSDISGLPPPLPVFEGREARALLSMTLARCWASSLAALDAALRRRLLRGASLEAVLESGRLPTKAELRAWVVGDDAVQLAFPLLVSHSETDTSRMGRVLRVHLCAVRALRARIGTHIARDAGARASLLTRLRATNPHARIVAFTSYAATAEALYRALRRSPGVALLTARGARSASGARSREDVLRALGPRDPSRPHNTIDEVTLVLATDVLSEGVNLQGASVVMHLDIPWTPAGLDQRVGRAARIGSEHECVHVHGFAAPRGAERLLDLERRLVRKHAEGLAGSRASVDLEALRRVVTEWRSPARAPDGAALCVAVRAAGRGFLAVVASGGRVQLVGGVMLRSGTYRPTDEPGALLALALSVDRVTRSLDSRSPKRVRAAIGRWILERRAHVALASTGPATDVRRTLLGRLDRVLSGAPAHSRADLARRIGVIRTRVESAVGAGAERTLSDLAHASTDGIMTWLTQCERRLAPTALRDEPTAEATGEPIRAILILTA